MHPQQVLCAYKWTSTACFIKRPACTVQKALWGNYAFNPKTKRIVALKPDQPNKLKPLFVQARGRTSMCTTRGRHPISSLPGLFLSSFLTGLKMLHTASACNAEGLAVACHIDFSGWPCSLRWSHFGSFMRSVILVQTSKACWAEQSRHSNLNRCAAALVHLASTAAQLLLPEHAASG